MIKRMGMFTRRIGMDRSQFSRHWAMVHRRIAGSMPGTKRYIQNHVFDPLDQPCATVPSYQIDGIAEMWWTDAEAMEQTFNSEPARLWLLHDEPNFMGAISVFLLEEDGESVADGTVKVIAPMRALSGMAEAAAAWRARLRTELPAVLRSVESRVVDTRKRSHLPPDPVLPDFFLEFRFRSIQEAEAAITSSVGREIMMSAGTCLEKFGFHFMSEHTIISQ